MFTTNLCYKEFNNRSDSDFPLTKENDYIREAEIIVSLRNYENLDKTMNERFKKQCLLSLSDISISKKELFLN